MKSQSATKLSSYLDPAEPPSHGYIRQSQLIPGMLPFSPATLWRKVKNGTFPRPVKLSDRITAWRVEDVRAWMSDPASFMQSVA